LEEGEVQESRRAILYGAGLEFIGENGIALFGELTLDYLSDLRDRMTIAENPWYLGLGLKFDLPLRLKIGASTNICLSRDDFGTAFEPHYPRIIANLGLQWTWQMLAGDPDGDGVRGSDDLCPDRPEDRDGFEDGDGCPDPDNDRDGVPDSIDLAPMLAEDFDGFEDEDGRPDLDNDNDGIPDRQDLCPDRAEDFDGIDDEDGCPDREEAGGGSSDAAPGDDGAPSGATTP
jgi:hypothetical protein